MSADASEVVAVPSVYQKLAARFPASAHKTKTIGGRDLTYVDGEMVVSRLNEVLGFDGWSFKTGTVTVTEREVWVTGALTVYSGDRSIVREQAGGQIINRTKAGEIIELSNDIKGAVTDCLKKCATLVGIGLYLYDPSERREVEQEMREAKRPKAQTGSAATSVAAGTSPASRSASTRSAASAAPSSSSTTATAAVLTGADPTALKTKAELAADLRKGVEYARSLGLDVEDVDPAPMNRADIEDTINALRQMCRDVLAERRKQQQAVS